MLRYLFERGQFETSVALAETAEASYSIANLQDMDLLLADIYTVQGAVLLEIKGADKASALFEKAMEIREAAVAAGVLDQDHPNRANSYMNHGVSNTNDNASKAIELHNKALSIRQRTPKYAQDQMQGLALNHLNLGRCLILTNRLDEAAEAFDA